MVATLLRCGCPDCSCSVEPPKGVKKGEKWYCSLACAEGHPEGAPMWTSRLSLYREKVTGHSGLVVQKRKESR